ncbi:MAG TPA: alpha-hydroxy acid oxidase [Candidatus Acidoferrum sp.]|nr:alpha-hydroxy acid oxidase [Candidatus Acidoferrum sp.]
MTTASVLAPAREPDPRLDAIVRLAGFEAIARERMAPAAFDYVAGGAGDEESLADNEAAWRRRRIRPRVLIDVSRVETGTTMLETPVAMPLAVAPMASHGLAHPDGEAATARAASLAGVPFTLSTMSSRSIEEVAAAAPDGIRWFQLYIQSDRGFARSLVERAEMSGYRAIVLTVDLPVLGIRERDRRHGFVLDVPLGNFEGRPDQAAIAEPSRDAPAGVTHASLTWDDIEIVRSWTRLPIVLKGILTAEDARLAAAIGVAAVVVSNHGARQLDRTISAVDALEEIVEAVAGRSEVWIDGGVRRGIDIVIARALGAQGVLIGRPILWALAAGGDAGVTRALAILREELEVAMALTGTPTIAQIGRAHVR